LTSNEWSKRSGGYDASKEIDQIRNAQVITNPGEFIEGTNTKVVESDGQTYIQLNMEDIESSGRDVNDVLHHEFSHIGYPDFGGNDTLKGQRKSLITQHKLNQTMENDRSFKGEIYRSLMQPFLFNLAEGKIDRNSYHKELERIKSEIDEKYLTPAAKREDWKMFDRLKRFRNRELPWILKELEGHELRQKLMEKRNNPSNTRLDNAYSKEALKLLQDTIAMNKGRRKGLPV